MSCYKFLHTHPHRLNRRKASTKRFKTSGGQWVCQQCVGELVCPHQNLYDYLRDLDKVLRGLGESVRWWAKRSEEFRKIAGQWRSETLREQGALSEPAIGFAWRLGLQSAHGLGLLQIGDELLAWKGPPLPVSVEASASS